ncbi:T9SS type A sorting domain-containing protein [Marinoscillum sp. MHG1-6]|uniref:T9SS type A sorting domain-containing protein n=1 Tax=Marinoscillum sp. MHG1-6 TaxID=2959627 RepID=UPI002157FB4C|nr:T9SS type A sorting domain-containing protein [Marinoscillum sp. MHG1-6]
MRFIFSLVLCVLLLHGKGQTISSATSGNWSSPSTWQGGAVPGSTDDVLIEGGHIVVIDMNSAGTTLGLCNNLTVQMQAELRLGYNGSEAYNKLAISGDILCDGTISAGREVPADINLGEGLIYDQNSAIILQLSQDTTWVTGKGYLHPKSLIIENQGSDRQLIIDHYNLITDQSIIVKGQATVNLIIEKYAYINVGGTLGITGETFAGAPTGVSANLTNHGIIFASNVNLFTKNAGIQSSITLEANGVISASQLNGGVSASSSAGGFNLELKANSVFRTGEGTSSPVDIAAGDVNFSVVNNGVIKVHYASTLSTGAEVSGQVSAFDKSNRDAIHPMKDKIGATHIAGWYHFTQDPFMEEGISQFKKWGSRNIKTTISANNGKMYEAYPFNHNWPTFNEPAEVVVHPAMDTLFSDPYFTTHAFWAPSKGVNGYYKNGADRNHDRFLDTEEQIYQAASAILSNYGHLDKTFIFQNWEGDWMLRGNNRQWEDNAANIPDDVMWQIEGMARMWRAHMRGIERAVSEHPGAIAKVQYAVEFNKLFYNTGGSRKTMMELGVPCVIADVLPRVRSHLSSWSSYDGNFEESGKPYPTGLWNGVEIADYYTNDTDNLEGVPVQLGEIGMNENPVFSELSAADITDRYDKIVAMVGQLGLANVYLWNLYGSGAQNVTLEKGVEYDTQYLYDVLDGKWVIEPDNTFGIAGGHIKDTYFSSLNQAPELVNPLADLILNQGFGSYTIDLGNLFEDGNGDALTFNVSLSDETLVNAEIVGSELTLTELITGNLEITIAVDDGYEGTATDDFELTVVPTVNLEVFIDQTTYGSIAEAIMAAIDGDVIEIRGIHTEVLNIEKSVTLRGQDPRSDKIQAAESLEASTSGVIYIARPDGMTADMNVAIENLGIRFGKATENGGGIFADKLQGKLTLQNLIIEYNQTDRNGGGVSVAGSDLDMIECTLANNFSTLDGGGMILAPNNAVSRDSNIKIIRSLIDRNEGRNGGGIYINGNKDFGNSHFIDVNLENTTIAHNITFSNVDGNGGGAIWARSALWTGDNSTVNVSLQMTHCTLYRNSHASLTKNGIQFTGTPTSALTNFSIYNSIIISQNDISEVSMNFANANTTNAVNNIFGAVNDAPIWLEDALKNNTVSITAATAGLANSLSNEGGTVYVLPLVSVSLALDYCSNKTGILLPLDDARGASRDELPDAGAYECTGTCMKNSAPVVVNLIQDITLSEGFESYTIDLSNVFSDADGDQLNLSVGVSDEQVVTANVDGVIMTLLEVAAGTATVTVTAEDGKGASISEAFTVNVETVLRTNFIDRFTLYPNPAINSFQVDLGNRKAQISVLNNSGISVFEGSYQANSRYDIGILSPGLYVVLIELDSGQILKTKMVVIQE